MVYCERCRKQFIDEEFSDHLCTPMTTKMQEIGIDYLIDGELNENGDKVYIANGLNGILYRLVECPHNPTHTNTYETTFDNEIVRFNFERALTQTPNLNTKKKDDWNPDDLTELQACVNGDEGHDSCSMASCECHCHYNQRHDGRYWRTKVKDGSES